jgi:hypothetical protein
MSILERPFSAFGCRRANDGGLSSDSAIWRSDDSLGLYWPTWRSGNIALLPTDMSCDSKALPPADPRSKGTSPMEISERRRGRPPAPPQTLPLFLHETHSRVRYEVIVSGFMIRELRGYVEWAGRLTMMAPHEVKARTVDRALAEYFKRDKLWRKDRDAVLVRRDSNERRARFGSAGADEQPDAIGDAPGIYRTPTGYRVRVRAMDPNTGMLKGANREFEGITLEEAVVRQAELRGSIRAGGRNAERERVKYGDYATSLFKRKLGTGELKSAKSRERWAQTQDGHLLPAFGDWVDVGRIQGAVVPGQADQGDRQSSQDRKGPHAAVHAADLSGSRSRGERPRFRGSGHFGPRHDVDAGALQQRQRGRGANRPGQGHRHGRDHQRAIRSRPKGVMTTKVVMQVVMQSHLPRVASPRNGKSLAKAGL